MTNYVWLKALFEPVREQSSSRSRKQSQSMKTRVSEAITKWNLAEFTCEKQLVESATSIIPTIDIHIDDPHT